MINISSNYPILYPIKIIAGLLWVDDNNGYEILQSDTNSIEWGHPNGMYLLSDQTKGIPLTIDMIWLAITENKMYSITQPLSVSKIKDAFDTNLSEENEPIYQYVVVGIAPYGKVSLWVFGDAKCKLIEWLQGELFEDIDIILAFPNHDHKSLINICQSFINEDKIVRDNLEKNGLPPRDLFDNYMKQFTYRYLPLFEHWDKDEKKWSNYGKDEQETKPQFDYIEEALYDGTHDKLHDGGLLNYHEAGKPKKLAMKWHIKKSEYTAYFWFEDEAIRAVFDRFYGLHPETKTDFIIHIDPMKNKYQLALYRYGLREPQIIPEEAYQFIVFKNKFEHFRSENYDQPRGAWIW